MKVTLVELTTGWTTWKNDTSLQSEVRFGQYMWNKYASRHPDQAWPELFYADTNKAYELLYLTTVPALLE